VGYYVFHYNIILNLQSNEEEILGRGMRRHSKDVEMQVMV